MPLTHRSRRPLLGVAALVLAAVGCFDDDNNRVLGPTPDALFRSYVALGNSITAGWQSNGINDSTQRRAYPVLLATQMDTRFAYPSLAGRGCNPPIANFLTQARVGTGSTATIGDTGTGSAQAVTIYGRVGSGQTSAPAGSYADTVSVTVTY